MWRWIRRLALYIPLTVAAALVVVYLALPWPVVYRWHDPETTSFMRYREREARRAGDSLELRHAWVALDDIAPVMRRAVVVAEDGRFREHHGVDWEAIAEELHYRGGHPFSWTSLRDLKAAAGAVGYYWRHRDEVRGRSTITQQLGKNLYFTPERSLARKAAELVVAQRLEWFLDKDRILELYLNTAELGPGVFGVESAARAYFHTSAAKLTRGQAASLAATLPQPLTSNPGHRPGRMAWRRDMILARLNRGGDRLPPIPDAPPALETPDVPVDGAPADAAPPDAEAPHAPLDTAPAVEAADTASDTGTALAPDSPHR